MTRYIFVDRDGVINKDPGGWTPHSYVTQQKDLKFLPGSLAALKRLKGLGYKVIVISNQAGVGKGLFTKARLESIDAKMRAEVSVSGGEIEESFYCIHRSDENCSCRKPKTGLLERAARKYRIRLHGTFFIGDNETDIVAGATLRQRTVLVESGKCTAADARVWTTKPDYIFKDLLAVANWLAAKVERKEGRAMRRKDERS